MPIKLTHAWKISLLKNVAVPGRVIPFNALLDWTLLIADALHRAGYVYQKIITSEAGFTLLTLYGHEEVRFALRPVSRHRIMGLMTLGRRRRFAHIGVVVVHKNLVNVISDTDEAYPSLTLSL